jgi:hypothetical protein
MKRTEAAGRSPEPPDGPFNRKRLGIQNHFSLDSVLTDAVLDELKKQSTAGCVLCSLEELDGEDWE